MENKELSTKEKIESLEFIKGKINRGTYGHYMCCIFFLAPHHKGGTHLFEAIPEIIKHAPPTFPNTPTQNLPVSIDDRDPWFKGEDKEPRLEILDKVIEELSNQ